MLQLSLKAGALEGLLKYAKDQSPLEAIAFLLGTVRGEVYSVSRVRRAKNADASAAGFSVSPEELYDVYTSADDEGLSVVGLFHSHPAPPFPSAVDLSYMKLNNFVWVIASSVNWQVKAYILVGARLDPVKILG